MNLDASLSYGGMNLLTKQQGLAIVTEGDPSSFDGIHAAVSRLAARMTNAIAPLTTATIRAEFSNWVEVSASSGEARRVVGFMDLDGERSTSISNEQIKTAHTLVPLMSLMPYLDLALSGYSQALEYP